MDNATFSKWGDLGVALYNKTNEEVDPEVLLIESLCLFSEDRKLLALVCTWIASFADMVHIERLKQLAKKADNISLIWLNGLANKASKIDRRWSILQGSRSEKVSVSEWDELQGMRVGFDPDFFEAGLRIANLKETYEKKLLPREYVIKNKTLFALRSLFGTNWRADIVWMKCRFPDASQYALAKMLGCNTETVYRINKQLQLIGNDKILEIVRTITAKAA